MSRKKTFKNPDVTDAQRDRVLKRRELELIAEAEEIWRWKKPKTDVEKFVDFIAGKKIEDHVTDRLIKGVMWRRKYGSFYYPKTKDEKWDDRLGLVRVYLVVHDARRNPKYRYISIGSEVLHENPDTKDKEYVLFDFNAERSKNTIKKSQVLAEWEANRTQLTDSMIETTNQTVENGQRPKSEIERLQREEQERRRRKNNNTDDEDKNN